MSKSEKEADLQEQYDILLEEEQEKQKQKVFWILFFCLIIVLFSVLTATYSYYRTYVGTDKKLNIDTDKDGLPDLNVDLDDDGICDVNCDIDGDGKPDINLDYNKDLKAHFNIDTDGDGIPDQNLLNQKDENGVCRANCDNDGDGRPDTNLDFDNDGKPDVNIDTNNDGKPDMNVDTDGDGKPDKNVDTDGDGKPDRNVDTDGDGICDLNCDGEKPEEKPKEPVIEILPEQNETGILYLNYIQGVNVDDMQPGTTVTQTFTVENQSNYPITFNLNWIDVTNQLTVLEGFTYQVRRDGAAITGQIPIPSQDSALFSNVMIAAHTTYSYEIDYTFHNLEDINQTVDLNKLFKAKIQGEIAQ